MEVISGTILPLLQGYIVIDGKKVIEELETQWPERINDYWDKLFALLERIEKDKYFVVKIETINI